MQTTTSNLLAKVTSCPVLEDSSILLTNGIGQLIRKADGSREKLAELTADLVGNPNAWAAGMLANTPQARHLQTAADVTDQEAAPETAKETATATPAPRRANSRKASPAPAQPIEEPQAEVAAEEPAPRRAYNRKPKVAQAPAEPIAKLKGEGTGPVQANGRKAAATPEPTTVPQLAEAAKSGRRGAGRQAKAA